MHPLLQLDQKYIWHPYKQMLDPSIPQVIVKGKGAYLYDIDGKTYLDGISSWWVNLHGHGHPYISQKIYEQALELEHVIFANFTHPIAIQLVEKLFNHLPTQMSKVFFSDNGSTAVETALKMCFQYWSNKKIEKSTIISFKEGYHGDTFGAMSAAGSNSFNQAFANYLFKVETIDPPYYGKEEKSMFQLQKIIEKGNCAGFIFEPLILGAGGMKAYSLEALESLLKLCHQNDIITIADEVMTGFGRLNTVFACNQLKEQPDIMCLSKGLTGGFLPMGLTVCKEFIHEAFHSKESSKLFAHGHSFTGNPLGCAAALASLELLESNNCSSQRQMITKCHQQCVGRLKDHHRLLRCECIGTVLILEFKTEEQTSYFNKINYQLHHYFLDHGIFLRPLGNVLYVLPPYCITKSELEKIYHVIEEILELI